MGVFGSLGGSIVGKQIGGEGVLGDVLGGLGGLAGSLLPFEKGGRVPRDTPAILHKNEYVLPVGVKPTKAQIKAVNKGKAKKSAPKKQAKQIRTKSVKSAPKRKSAPKKKKAKFV